MYVKERKAMHGLWSRMCGMTRDEAIQLWIHGDANYMPCNA